MQKVPLKGWEQAQWLGHGDFPATFDDTRGYIPIIIPIIIAMILIPMSIVTIFIFSLVIHEFTSSEIFNALSPALRM